MTLQDPRFAARLVGSLRTGLLGIDRRGGLVALSPEAARILGCPPPHPELLGRPVRTLLEDQPEVADLLESALDGHERPGRAELRLHGDRGCTIGYTLLPLRDDAGRLEGAAMLFRDLTPFERRDEQARLHDRLLALGSMAARFAHEVRNPLASVEVLLGLLKRELGDRPEALSLVEELQEELRELAATVSATLAFVRPQAIVREPLDPGVLLREALARARARSPFAGDVALHLAPRLGPLRGDPERLRAVLVELLVNALQAMAGTGAPAGGHRLRISAEPDGRGAVVFAVADTGPGVPPELRERIFHPFFTTRPDGSGVGLAEVQKVVAAHGGWVDVAGAAGGGAVFRIRLPGSAEEEGSPGTPAGWSR